MHLFVFFHALMFATFVAVVGFFVLFAAARAAGAVRTIGSVLGWWLIVLAAIGLIGGIVATVTGHGGMGWRRHGWGAEAPATAAPPTAPATR